MTITVVEPADFNGYSSYIDLFQRRMQDSGKEERASFSEEQEAGKKDIRRFIAMNDSGMVVGWMIVKIQPEDVKIEGICTDPDKSNSAGAAKALVEKAVNCSMALGKGGTVTLFNFSKGTGDRFYAYMGFKYITEDGEQMRLEINSTDWDIRPTGETVETKRGKFLPVVEHYLK